ncbi:MAG: hypothetical protein HRU28_10380 [Rhizobiales bacterium]|nr:hypothetical protein [Hyphomicrobiales bacterium]
MKGLAKGDLETDTRHLYWIKELGNMAKSLIIFKENAVARQQAESEKQTQTADQQRKSQYINELISGFQKNSNDSISQVNLASTELKTVSKSLDFSATDMQDQSKTVTDNVQDTSNNVNNAASAVKEMASSIAEIAQQASLSTDIAAKAKQKTNDTVLVIEALSSSAEQIEQVVKLIEEIADQTNLLALNATIEAARAGDAGKGFAVVASEVKNLANQTARATEEIADCISTIRQDSTKANSAIREVEDIISKLSNSSLGVATSVEEQSAVITDISQNVNNASKLSTQNTQSMNEVGSAIDKTKLASTDVSLLSAKLNSQVSRLENDISEFLIQVKSV